MKYLFAIFFEKKIQFVVFFPQNIFGDKKADQRSAL